MYIYDRRLLGFQFPLGTEWSTTWKPRRRYNSFRSNERNIVGRRQFGIGLIEGLGDIKPEDIAVEMVGRSFTVSAPFSSGLVTLSSGDTVKARSWDNTSSNVRVRKTLFWSLDVPKRLLRPVAPTVVGIIPYSAGVQAQAQAVERGERAIANWQAKAPTFRTAKGRASFNKELLRLKGLQQTRERALNRQLIQETMFNRFDPLIDKWTTFHNSKFGFTGANALDPNWIKSMFFQESEIGTAGRHLEDPPSHPARTRFNLGQAVDSSGAALLVMIEEMEPTLVTTHHLENLRKDLDEAKKERKRLKKLRSRTPAENANLAELDRLSTRSWEIFIWEYKASGQSTGFSDAVLAFFSNVPSGQPHRNLDYEFWIRTAIRWLFEKHKGRSWKEAVRAYNGVGPRAEKYRDAVLERVRQAVAAQQSGKSFIPRR